MAFIGTRGGQDYVVFHQIETGPYDRVFYLHFAPLGDKLGYTATRQNQFIVVLGSHEYPVAGGGMASDVTLAPDSEHVAYLTLVGEKFSLCVNDHVVTEFAPDEPAPLDRFDMNFNHNGHLLTFPLIGPNNEWAAVADLDRNIILKSPAYDRVRDVHFAPDGKSVLFGALKGSKFLKISMAISN
jgi:hypothetical protein